MSVARALGMVGLCARAGMLVTGEQACEQLVKRGGSELLLYDAGISNRSKKGLRDACAYAGIQMIELPRDALGDAVGKPGRMAAAVTDKQFADRIRALMAPDESGARDMEQDTHNAGVH